MNDCALPATGPEPGVLILLIAVAAALVAAGILLRRRSRIALFLAAPLVLGLALVPAAPQPGFAADCPEFTPGAAGIGDPYYPFDGNGGYDVQHYDLDLAYDPQTGVLSGAATIEAVATQNLSAFNLDFDTRDNNGDDAIVIGSVTVDGTNAARSLTTIPISIDTGQPNEPGSGEADATPPRTELTVTPASGILNGSTFVTVIAYSGVPITIDDVFGPGGVIPADQGIVVIGEPRVAATWFPANDHPADKATMTLRMAVPDGLSAIGNGRLLSSTSTGGVTTWSWSMDRPMATYLATATIGDYEVTEFEEAGIAYFNAIDPDLYSRIADGGGAFVGDVAEQIFDSEPEVIAFLETVFGPYPFTEAGGIAVDEIGPGEDLPYALEVQTRPIYPAWAFPADADAYVVVHELAHQWYGDSVSIARWQDIWLNEGFATYAEWLWDEHDGGPTAQDSFDYYYANLPSGAWTTVVADPGPTGIFDLPVYYRGALALHALRVEIGDTDFFALLQGWAAEHADRSLTTEDFIAYAESVSGKALGTFFDEWIYQPDKPAV